MISRPKSDNLQSVSRHHLKIVKVKCCPSKHCPTADWLEIQTQSGKLSGIGTSDYFLVWRLFFNDSTNVSTTVYHFLEINVTYCLGSMYSELLSTNDSLNQKLITATFFQNIGFLFIIVSTILTLVRCQLLNFVVRHMKLCRLLLPKECSQRTFWYLVRLFNWEK